MPKVTRRQRIGNGITEVFVTELECHACQKPLEDRWFGSTEPQVAMCADCTAKATREDYGNVATGHRAPRPMRFVAAESQPGKSSGKERKSMSYGDAENANGLWDNLIREMES